MNQAILSAGGTGIRPHGDQAGKTPFGLMQ